MKKVEKKKEKGKKREQKDGVNTQPVAEKSPGVFAESV